MNTLNHILRALFGPRPVFANVATGVHEGGITYELGEAIAMRNLLGRISGGKVYICNGDEQPAGVITDTGESGDYINLAPLSNSAQSLLMYTAEAIAAGEPVYTSDDGGVQNQPTGIGDFYHVGYAVTAASAAGQLVEVSPQPPLKTKIISAFTGTAATDIAALGAALETAPDKVIVLS